LAEHARKQDGHRQPFWKKTEAYKPTAIPAAFQVLNGSVLKNHVGGEDQPLEFQSENRGSYRLAGIQHGTDFPGWEGKPNWLNRKFVDFRRRISELSGFRQDSLYFIYHIVPWEGFIVCAEVDDSTDIPRDFVKLSIPAIRYDIYTHNGTMSGQPETFERIFNASNGGEEDQEMIHFERYDGHFDFSQDTGSFKIYIPVKQTGGKEH
jgi:predicted transcriptional regulator YdeE